MELRTETDKLGGVSIHRVSGELTYDAFSQALVNLYQRTALQPGHNTMWDLRKANLNEVSAAHLRRVAEFVGRHWGTQGVVKVALLVSRDVSFGKAQTLEEALRGYWEARVFRNFSVAAAWLNSEG